MHDTFKQGDGLEYTQENLLAYLNMGANLFTDESGNFLPFEKDSEGHWGFVNLKNAKVDFGKDGKITINTGDAVKFIDKITGNSDSNLQFGF